MTESQVTEGSGLKKEVSGKPRKLLSLQYNYSDSDDEETREERKARIVSTVIITYCTKSLCLFDFIRIAYFLFLIPTPY